MKLGRWLLAINSARSSVLRYPDRALLSIVGIVIGIASVVLVVALSASARDQIGHALRSFGEDSIWITASKTSGRSTEGRSKVLRAQDAREISQLQGVIRAAPASESRRQSHSAFDNARTGIVGVGRHYLSVAGDTIGEGRDFTAREFARGARVGLIGDTLSRDLFAARDPIGRKVRVGKHTWTIVGRLKPKGRVLGGVDQDDRLWVPLRAYQTRIAPSAASGVGRIVVSTEAGTHEQLTQRIDDLLRQRHGLSPQAAPNYRIVSQDFVRRTIDQVSSALTLLLLCVAAVSLVSGAVGVMNVMLAGVAQRKREVGLRMTLGARRVDIALQFSLEAVGLCVFGGCCGLALAAGLGAAISSASGWQLTVNRDAAWIAFITATITGLASGAWPAWRAASADPIDALRTE